MTTADETRSGQVSSAPCPDPGVIPTPAEQALNAVLDAPTSVEQLRAYDQMRAHLTDFRAAIRDDVCNRVIPVGAWFSGCMRGRRDRPHTTENQRWAVAADLRLPTQWPLIENCWKEEA